MGNCACLPKKTHRLSETSLLGGNPLKMTQSEVSGVASEVYLRTAYSSKLDRTYIAPEEHRLREVLEDARETYEDLYKIVTPAQMHLLCDALLGILCENVAHYRDSEESGMAVGWAEGDIALGLNGIRRMRVIVALVTPEEDPSKPVLWFIDPFTLIWYPANDRSRYNLVRI